MPPHCDSLDGPVVTAARSALDSGRVEPVLAYVPEDAEDETRRTFAAVSEARRVPAAREVADRHFFETVVRLHRAGEGAPFTGLKPAGLPEDPAITIAERAIESGSADELAGFLCAAVETRARAQLEHIIELRERADGDLAAQRAYVSAVLGLQVWAHQVHDRIAHATHGS